MVFIPKKGEATPRTMIIRPSALGDTLLLAPALHQIAGAVPLTLVGRRPGIDLLDPFLKGYLDYESGAWHTLFSREPKCRDLPLGEVERIISFLSDPDGHAERGLRKCLKDTPVFWYPPFPPKGKRIHVAKYLALCLHNSGLPVKPEHAIEEAKKRPLLGKRRPAESGHMLVLHPGSGGLEKNYSHDFWFNLLKERFIEMFHKRIVLLGPAEGEFYHILTNRRSTVNADIVHCPHKDGLLSLLNEASWYIGHDSGITHLAAMLGTPTIALFKKTLPAQWSPLGPDVTVIDHARGDRAIREKIKAKLALALHTSNNGEASGSCAA
jgi:heptosyltransferase-3